MAEIYDTDRFGELYYASRRPTPNHALLAASHIAQICQNASIPHAFLGGWTVRLRGGTRETQDIDITVATTMEVLKKALLRMPRICFPRYHGQKCVNLFVHTGMSYDESYKNLPNLAVQVDAIISGYLNSPTRIDDTTSELLTLPNGYSVRVVNVFYLLQGKFHAFNTRGQTNTNDYQDLVFLITTYRTHMLRYSSHLDKAHRFAFLRKYAEMNGGNKEFVDWMRQMLGLVREEADDDNDDNNNNEEDDDQYDNEEGEEAPAETSDWVWDQTQQRYRILLEGNWQWAPVQQQSSIPNWLWDQTEGRYGRWINGVWQWAPTSSVV